MIFFQTDAVEVCELFGIIGLGVWNFVLTRNGADRERRIIKLENQIQTSVDAEKKRSDFYEAITSPEKIVRDMELSASADEMRRANRTTAPRADAGPPAKVHKPKSVRASGSFRGNRPVE